MKIGVDKNYKGYSVFDYEKLYLEKDQVARICLLDPDPTPENPNSGIDLGFAHWVDIPGDKRKSGYYMCFGRYDLIFGAPGTGKPGVGHDSEKCIFCRYQVNGGAIGLCAKRYATNVLVYLTDNKGTIRPGPLMADTKTFRFGEDKFNRLADIRTEYGDPKYGLQTLDLACRCDVKQYQRFTIDPLKDCLWRSADEATRVQIYKSFFDARLPDLSELLGNKIDEAGAERLVAEALGTVGAGNGGGMVAPTATPQDLQRLLDDSSAMVKGNAPPPPVHQPQPLPPPPGPVLVQQTQPQHAQMPATPGPVRVPPPPPPPPQTGHIPPPPSQVNGAPMQSPPPPAGAAPIMPSTGNFDDLLKM